MDLHEWETQGRFLTCREHSIFCRRQGQGESLLCIHGYPTASWDWHRIWPSLTQRFSVTALDMIGFGLSDKPRGYDYSICDQATLHEELLQQLGITRTHILAHDYGDSVAQELLARQLEEPPEKRPFRIRSCAFLNGGLIPGTHRPLLIQKLLAGPLGGIISGLISRSRFDKSFSTVFAEKTRPSPQELDEFWQLINRNGGRIIQGRISRYMTERKRLRERWVGILQQTDVPLRFICGAVDPVSGAPVAESYRELVPNPDVVLLEGVGHYPQIEAPEKVWEALEDFFSRQDAKIAKL